MTAEMEMVKVTENRDEARGISTIFFESEREDWYAMTPGQFVMIWVPGVDEVPMSISYNDGEVMGITVQGVGEASRAICALKEGEWIGVRGPYGNGFIIPEDCDTVIGLAGGVGAASVVTALEEAFNNGIFVTSLVGARDESSLLFQGRWERFSGNVVYSTDDGSFGHPGFITEPLQDILDGMSKEEISRTVVLACGPEMMMVNSSRVLKEFNAYGLFSLERLMKCGVGLCDSCAVSGLRVCADGPVFTCDQLDEIEEFGNTHRDRSGRSVPIDEVI